MQTPLNMKDFKVKLVDAQTDKQQYLNEGYRFERELSPEESPRDLDVLNETYLRFWLPVK